ncbi:hypothetical protein AGMMS49940_13330 [Spirochaetia bacterium]|nr:hypothetical protein AGMMS49940_13330 [Spirochaetia bacterium]
MKLLNTLRGKIALAGLFALVALGLGSCANALTSAGTYQNAGGDATVQIRLSAGDARTIIPSAGFAKYELTFTPLSGPSVYETLTGVDTADITLSPETWTIDVAGYVNVGDANPSAIGTETVILGAGEHAVVPITLSPETGGANGTFQYTIIFPPAGYFCGLRLYDSSDTTVIDQGYSSDQTNVTRSLAPGYYRLYFYIADTSGNQIARSEMVHIYPNLTTEVTYNTFTDADFGPVITIDGVVDLNGLDGLSNGELVFYDDSDYSNWVMSVYANPSTGAWSVDVASFNSPTPWYLMLLLYFNDGTTVTKYIANPITVYNTDLTVPTLGPFPVNRYTIGGNLDLSGIETYFTLGFYSGGNYGSILIYADDGSQNLLVQGNIQDNGGVLSWEAPITADAATLPVIIQWRVPVGSGRDIYEQKKLTLSGNTSGLNFAPTVLKEGVQAARETGIGGSPPEDYFLFVPDSFAEYILRVSGTGSASFDLDLYALNGSHLANWSGYSFTEITVNLNAGTAYLVFVRPQNTSSYQFLATPSDTVAIDGTFDVSGITGLGFTIDDLSININGYSADNINPLTGAWDISTTAGTTASVQWYVVFNSGAGYLSGSTLVPITGSAVTAPPITPVILSGDSVTQTMQTGYQGESSFIFKPATTTTFRLNVTSTDAFDVYFDEWGICDAATGVQVFADSYDGSTAVVSLDGGTPYTFVVYTDPVSTSYTFTAAIE